MLRIGADRVMFWGDGERLGADHTVTFMLGDGEEANAYAVTTATLPKGQNGCLNLFSVCTQDINAIYSLGINELMVTHQLHTCMFV